MFTSSPQIILLLNTFAPLMSAPALAKTISLICGVILASGRRTVTSDDKSATFGKYHRLLSRDRWSALHMSGFLLTLLLDTFSDPNGIIQLVIDETLERRSGKCITYKGWFRDAVRSTKTTTVTTQGVRWLCLCLLVRVPWSKRKWALPFCTIPACSEKTCDKRRRPNCSPSDWAIDLMLKVREWVGNDRRIRLMADGGFTAIDFLDYCRTLFIAVIGRIRIDAAFHDEPAPRQLTGELTTAGELKKKSGPIPLKGARQISLKKRLMDPETVWTTIVVPSYGGQEKSVEILSEVSLWYVVGHPPMRLRWVLVRPSHSTASESKSANEGKQESAQKKISQKTDQAAVFYSTDVNITPEEILAGYTERWNIEVFFEEVRACLGFETQRGWTNLTIGRTTPCLFGVFSLIVILAKRLYPSELPIRQTAWYKKEEATFHDALCAVRGHLWDHNHGNPRAINTIGSAKNDELCLIPKIMLRALQEAACYAK